MTYTPFQIMYCAPGSNYANTNYKKFYASRRILRKTYCTYTGVYAYNMYGITWICRWHIHRIRAKVHSWHAANRYVLNSCMMAFVLLCDILRNGHSTYWKGGARWYILSVQLLTTRKLCIHSPNTRLCIICFPDMTCLFFIVTATKHNLFRKGVQYCKP